MLYSGGDMMYGKKTVWNEHLCQIFYNEPGVVREFSSAFSFMRLTNKPLELGVWNLVTVLSLDHTCVRYTGKKNTDMENLCYMRQT
jgi:hypothetical protein